MPKKGFPVKKRPKKIVAKAPAEDEVHAPLASFASPNPDPEADAGPVAPGEAEAAVDGQYVVEQILGRSELNLELAFVWNRTKSALDGKVDKEHILDNLDDFRERKADLIVEVAHPCITREYGPAFLSAADYLIGSPTAMADADVERKLREAANQNGLYVPSGALWGGQDIRKMADRKTLQALKVTMKKPPQSLKLEEPLKSKNDAVTNEAVTLYDGPVRGLCSLAPNNVNTMAAAAIAAHNLGFDKTQGCIVADPSLTEWHIVEVDVWGPGDLEKDTAFHCRTVRRNPAKIGAVTGSATYASVLASILGVMNIDSEEYMKATFCQEMCQRNCRPFYSIQWNEVGFILPDVS